MLKDFAGLPTAGGAVDGPARRRAWRAGEGASASRE